MYDIRSYVEAGSVEQATRFLADNPGLKIIAGGTDVLIKMQHGQLPGAELLSIRNIKALQRIEMRPDGSLVIGALATFTEICGNELIQAHIPALAEAAVCMGGPQIRNVATVGGNICNGATSADSASTLFALDAQLQLQSSTGERLVPIQEFYLGPGKVALRPGELLTAFIIAPDSYRGFGSHYIKFAMRQAMDIATLGVAVMCRTKAGMFEQVKIGLGVAGPTPLRCLEAETFAAGKSISQETVEQIGRLAVKSTNARTSWRASKEYREHLVEELTGRALHVAVVRAGGENIG